MSRFILLCFTVSFASFVLAGNAAQAAPEPELVSPSWQLDFDFERPDAIAVETLTGEVQWYWYMTYTVTNETGATRLFVPDITIADDTGRLMAAGEGVPSRVFRAIRDKLRSTALMSQTQIVGQLLEGDDYARTGVAIWPAAVQDDLDEYRVFVAGLSGETATTTDPITGETVLLRRTLMLRFELPGDDESPEEQPVILAERREVMR